MHFKDAAAWRAWLEGNHDKKTELYVGFWNKGTGRPSVTYKEAVDQALCYGWIDGVRGKHHPDGCFNRFTPRKARSTWSLYNVARVAELTKAGLMRPAGIKAFKARDEKNTGIYSAENKEKAVLPPAMEKRFRANTRAWAFFSARAAGYKRAAIWLIISAKREETKEKRLMQLIADSEAGRTIEALTRKTGK